MKAKLLMLFSALLIISGLNAQILEPVKWKYTLTQVENDDEVLLNAIAIIDNNFIFIVF